MPTDILIEASPVSLDAAPDVIGISIGSHCIFEHFSSSRSTRHMLPRWLGCRLPKLHECEGIQLIYRHRHLRLPSSSAGQVLGTNLAMPVVAIVVAAVVVVVVVVVLFGVVVGGGGVEGGRVVCPLLYVAHLPHRPSTFVSVGRFGSQYRNTKSPCCQTRILLCNIISCSVASLENCRQLNSLHRPRKANLYEKGKPHGHDGGL